MTTADDAWGNRSRKPPSDASSCSRPTNVATVTCLTADPTATAPGLKPRPRRNGATLSRWCELVAALDAGAARNQAPTRTLERSLPRYSRFLALVAPSRVARSAWPATCLLSGAVNGEHAR